MSQNTVHVDGHRARRGPYTAAGNLMRAIVPETFERDPRLVRSHVIEILSVAPELVDLIGAAPGTLTSLAVPKERTRFYNPLRTRRIANGLAEFVNDYTNLRGGAELRFGAMAEADPTDQEFLEILTRRACPALTVMLDPPSQRPATGSRGHDELVRAYIDSDGTSCDANELAAYEQADPELRAALHDARADELDRRGEQTLRLGPIPYHREHGSDPAGAGADALMAAVNYCLDMGYYHAVLDMAMRGRALIDPEARPELYWQISTKATTALALLDRVDEAEAIYVELRGLRADWKVHMASAYALAMLYTRFRPREQRDHVTAKAHINTSIAIAEMIEDPELRTFNSVFNRNGLALVEMHLGNPEEALRLLVEGADRLDRELAPDRHLLHRSVLRHNRAQVYNMLGDLDASLAELDWVIKIDPNYAEYYIDRAGVQHRRGQDEAALADYNHAASITPPFAELYYNRANLYFSMGDTAAAIADFAYALELEPTQLEARINLATTLLETGDLDGAARQVTDGLGHHPDCADLLAVRGLLAAEAGDADRALADFDAALRVDPALVTALANRALLRYENGEHQAAVDDLTAALAAGEDPDLLYNRGFAYQAMGEDGLAAADYTRALELPGADREELSARLALCRQEVA
ncbi:tetratricopeptide repeat protein [Kutzneria sp. CA-103260]|uniref:tetratricopeptide repeat protein n=1 Tax=Kutzneria sp. CA-103260 TaxID=2802641 RepID=UPI001BABD573|nr:tetratricopeptide repeat protein [Kutzneria sp. CA-103260]QUQ71111.1 Lipopolysaccharide assembly protein B [Kutzneria sp. CA-103260]